MKLCAKVIKFEKVSKIMNNKSSKSCVAMLNCTLSDTKKEKRLHKNVSLFSRGDRIRTCDHLVPNQARYRTALHPVSCKVSDFASAKVLIKSEPCKFFYNYLFKKQIISQTLLRETLWLSKRPFNKQLFKP